MELALNAPTGITAAPATSRRSRKRRPIPMVMKLAYRNLFHDRMSFFVTIVGIVFSVVLVAVQSGIYLGSQNKISAIIDAAPADLWVVPLGTKSYDDPSFLSGRERHMVLSTPGVENSEDMVVSFASWRKPQGGKNTVLLIGTAGDSSKALPWNIIKGSRSALEAPDTVAIDQSYFPDLGVNGLGQHAEINGASVELVAITKRIRSFTTLPFVFASIEEARRLSGAEQDQASYQRVTIAPGADIERVRAAIAKRLPDTEVLTQNEFRKRSQNYWLFQTGAGAALIAGALLGLIVGIVIVAQTLYSSTKDHINEFATLRALGAGASYIVKVILMQAVLSGLIGYILGMGLALLAIRGAQDTKLTVIMTPALAGGLFAVTVGMCVFAAISAIIKVVRIDPAVVFSR
ncbi:ABC transporter permease [Hyphomicrobium sp.]|jgi:putative ABC transport system permease protein|uniref:ABC transporter permease n=1 Tax=Hyphomicrobium sp. TaxID=82 RepID=UPI002BAD84D2|nr:ABC transporter permease [Hyphomicrobium sp.]HVZ04172.1 ABC transporter permease [Hyphomicrobium sp.]